MRKILFSDDLKEGDELKVLAISTFLVLVAVCIAYFATARQVFSGTEVHSARFLASVGTAVFIWGALVSFGLVTAYPAIFVGVGAALVAEGLLTPQRHIADNVFMVIAGLWLVTRCYSAGVRSPQNSRNR